MSTLRHHPEKIYLLLIIFFLGIHCNKENTPQVSKIEVKTTLGIINMATVSCGGEITSNNIQEIIERGICWDTLSAPIITVNKIASGKGSGIFSTEITGLKAGRDYYIRAYAKTNTEVIYGTELKFTTLALALISAAQMTGINTTSAIFNGEVVTDGGAVVTERGVCWNNSPNPTLNNSKATAGSGTGAFTVEIAGLTAATVYYARGYAITFAGTAYGNEVSFTTLGPPVITTTMISDVTQHTAVSGGNISSDGGAPITERGICWGTNPLPTINDSKTTDGTGAGIFSSTMTGLLRNTFYYVRAYATNSVSTSYGEQRGFSTIDPPIVKTTAVSNITFTTATSGGEVTYNGGGNVSQRGVCWSTNPAPTISDSKTSDGSGTGIYTSYIINLIANTKYYLRAYASNSAGTGYGEELTFITNGVSVPTVVTTNITNITEFSAQGGGNVTSDGGSPVLQRGICYSDYVVNPTIDDQRVRKTIDGSGTGAYISQLANLYPFNWYTVRAYATNSAGTGYGSVVTFNTLATTQAAPTLNTPADNANAGCCTINFTWSISIFAEFSQIQLSRSPDFSEANYSADVVCNGTEIPRTTGVFSTTAAYTSYCIRMDNSTLNGTWFWRVRTFGSGTSSSWSVVRSFIFTN